MIPTLFSRNITLPIVWRAPLSDGMGHAYGSGQAERAACGTFPFDTRFAHEVTFRCATCIALTGASQLPDRRRANVHVPLNRRVPVAPDRFDSPAGAGEDVEAFRG